MADDAGRRVQASGYGNASAGITSLSVGNDHSRSRSRFRISSTYIAHIADSNTPAIDVVQCHRCISFKLGYNSSRLTPLTICSSSDMTKVYLHGS